MAKAGATRGRAACEAPMPEPQGPLARDLRTAVAGLTTRGLYPARARRRTRRWVLIVQLAVAMGVAPSLGVQAHDWLTGKRAPDGRACCFATARNGRAPDCHVVTAQHVLRNWVVPDPITERTWWIPDDQAQPSEDGQFWLCRTPWDSKPRCFFVPKLSGPSTPGHPLW